MVYIILYYNIYYITVYIILYYSIYCTILQYILYYITVYIILYYSIYYIILYYSIYYIILQYILYYITVYIILQYGIALSVQNSPSSMDLEKGRKHFQQSIDSLKTRIQECLQHHKFLPRELLQKLDNSFQGKFSCIC